MLAFGSGRQHSVEVTFTPTDSLMFYCNLEIVSNDLVNPSVEVTLWDTGNSSGTVNLSLSSPTTSVPLVGEVPFTVELENTTGKTATLRPSTNPQSPDRW